MQEGPSVIEPAPEPAAVSPWKIKLQRFAIASGAVLAAIGIAYGVGRYQTSGDIDAAEQRATQTLDEKKSVEQTLGVERSKIKALEARRHLHLAALALDKRNFGIAQDHIDLAAKLLTGGAPSELEPVRSALGAFKLHATEDLETQRGKLLAFTQQFDAALPPLKL